MYQTNSNIKYAFLLTNLLINEEAVKWKLFVVYVIFHLMGI